MNFSKTVKLALSKFDPIPATLQNAAAPDRAINEIPVDLSDLYAYYHWDSWDCAPPDPNPAYFEQIRFLSNRPDFRFRPGGRGAATTFRSNKSHELGQAFCRWFLGTHANITYFAHLETVRDHGALSMYNDISVVTAPNTAGDAPDYFCASDPSDVFLAEAKGTNQAVGFGSKTWQAWRNQFTRVKILDSKKTPLTVKGFIVATRWASEDDGPRIWTKISAEDPETIGKRLLSDERPTLAAAIMSAHYASALRRIRQPLLSAAMERGFSVPGESRFRAFVWRSLLPELKGKTFVGGYYGPPTSYYDFDGDWISNHFYAPPRLDVAGAVFFGIETSVFKTLVFTSKTEPRSVLQLQLQDRLAARTSGLSFLRDGTVIGPLELFAPDGEQLFE
ncbi:hypothetical protein [Rhizobium laguerreae]|uniref:hypothetical protein n=1 Tax=Rhizobium laguerreae TaxID=1076926 RepID=UPI001C90CB8D|nr:hypothetical protein [Rhizobium laguerreae]MBY3556442.1 hypothetical protein [Rhizobium laguerreae]